MAQQSPVGAGGSLQEGKKRTAGNCLYWVEGSTQGRCSRELGHDNQATQKMRGWVFGGGNPRGLEVLECWCKLT